MALNHNVQIIVPIKSVKKSFKKWPKLLKRQLQSNLLESSVTGSSPQSLTLSCSTPLFSPEPVVQSQTSPPPHPPSSFYINNGCISVKRNSGALRTKLTGSQGTHRMFASSVGFMVMPFAMGNITFNISSVVLLGIVPTYTHLRLISPGTQSPAQLTTPPPLLHARSALEGMTSVWGQGPTQPWW